MKTDLAKNTVLLSVGNLLTKGINLVMIPLFSSWLSTSDYGSFDLYCTYVALLIPFISLSSSDALFRFAVEEPEIEGKRKYVTSALLINLIIGTIVMSSILCASLLFRWHVGLPLLLLLIGELANTHLQGFLRSIKKLGFYSAASVINTIVIAIFVTFFVLKCNLGLSGMIYGYALGYLISDLFIIFGKNYYSYIKINSVSKKTITEMVTYSAPLIPNNIAWWIINVADRSVINFFLGAASNGIYAIAYKIPNFCASIFNSFNISWQEAAVGVINSNEKKSYFNHIFNVTISTMISLCSGILAINYLLFEYVFDSRYYEAYLYSPILTTAVILSSLVQFFGGIQISLKQTKANGITTFIGAVANLLLNILFVKLMGIFAAAISTLVSLALISILRYCRLKKDDFDFSINKVTFLHIIYYCYMMVSCYIVNNLTWIIINLISSLLFFLYINKIFILKVIKKVKVKVLA